MEQLKQWLSDLFDGIENSENRDVCINLIKSCGSNCAKRNVLSRMTGMKAKISELSDMDEITKVINQHTGAECIPAIGGFIITYNRGKGCDCQLVCTGYVASPVFCNCTQGFHETVWGTIFEKPVTVELLETFLQGGNCCSYKITINTGVEAGKR